MLWFTLSLLTAFFNATEAAFLKRFFADLTSWEMTAFPFLYTAPMFALTLCIVPTPTLQPGFWPLLLVMLPLNMTGLIFHFRAIHLSQLSLIMPFLSFTPAFVLVTGFLFLGEVPSLLGGLGVGLIVLGGYVLPRTKGDNSLLGPLKALARDKGAVCMLIAAAIYGFSSVIGKMLILKSSPIFFANFFFCIFSVLVVVGFVASGRVRLPVLLSRPRHGLLVAVLIYAHITCHHLAIARVDAAYMMSIKRLNGIFSVGYGWLLFKDSNIRRRMVGASVMAAGAVLIGLFG